MQPPLSEFSFDLERFEFLVNDSTEEAFGHLLFVLRELNEQYGAWGPNFVVNSVYPDADAQHFCTRLASAITTLLSRPHLVLSEYYYAAIMDHHRWLATIFAVSAFRNGDHIIRSQNGAGGGVHDRITLNANNLRIFCLCYFPDSYIPLQPDALWTTDKNTVVRLFFALLSGRALPTPAGHAKREQLLSWLPGRMHEIESIDALPHGVLHDVYMHCSYADYSGKHEIKASINRLVRQQLLSLGFEDSHECPERKKPLLVVVLEWFNKRHSIYRTHSTTINALRKSYRVMGIARLGFTDEVARSVFDDFCEVAPDNDVLQIYREIKQLQPDVIYYPSVGMFPLTMYLINLRLAPLQLMALGHPATTHSSHIDGILVEEDYVGDAACFSEPLIRIPKDGMPYLPPCDLNPVKAKNRCGKTGPSIRVAVCASVMKINPGFLDTLAEIQARSRAPVQFVFYTALAHGIVYEYLRGVIAAKLPGAEINPHLDVQRYQEMLNTCHLFANPFPFGNTNGLVDCVRLALPGVCLTGPEVHTHIDEGLFRRLGLPQELIACDRAQYIQAVLRLVEDSAYRNALHQRLLGEEVEAVLFTGKPQLFVKEVNKARARQLASLTPSNETVRALS